MKIARDVTPTRVVKYRNQGISPGRQSRKGKHYSYKKETRIRKKRLGFRIPIFDPVLGQCSNLPLGPSNLSLLPWWSKLSYLSFVLALVLELFTGHPRSISEKLVD